MLVVLAGGSSEWSCLQKTPGLADRGRRTSQDAFRTTVPEARSGQGVTDAGENATSDSELLQSDDRIVRSEVLAENGMPDGRMNRALRRYPQSSVRAARLFHRQEDVRIEREGLSTGSKQATTERKDSQIPSDRRMIPSLDEIQAAWSRLSSMLRRCGCSVPRPLYRSLRRREQ